MRKGIAISASGAAALAVLATAFPAVAASAPRPVPGPGGVTIEIANMSGSGCRPGTAEAVLSADRETFTIAYSGFTARVGGASAPTDARKVCQISLKVNVPPRFTYAISEVQYRLGADLQPGAKAAQRSGHHLQGGPPATITTVNLAGPQNDDFQVVVRTPVERLVWKPCDLERDLGVNTELRADLGTSDPSKVSSISMNADGGNRTRYHFAWKQCA
ncbi:DUF4360 domain-containing protein [Actinomadura soli]|uniref:DUF4360 domain-containing protein n=1 Tax=Actinomadura soli TaxID=2508997 RepID=A0A5C4J6A6_9ACTN|nr:DUF4360 domain-containing protein [Actinomadura soli]TMQ92951.1 DUF4360 domain-containing protein [Actinomadura soli]